LIQNLQGIARKIHALGWIHGDFRPQNILRKNNRAYLVIDLDWAQKINAKPKYPIELVLW